MPDMSLDCSNHVIYDREFVLNYLLSEKYTLHHVSFSRRYVTRRDGCS